MPTVEITISERIAYSRRVEMTEAEYQKWCSRLDEKDARRAIEELASRYIRRGASPDFFDADSLILCDMDVVV